MKSFLRNIGTALEENLLDTEVSYVFNFLDNRNVIKSLITGISIICLKLILDAACYNG